MSRPISLSGITWDHTRGYAPLAATSQVFHDLRPDVDIGWERRTLLEFGEAPIETLAENHDLLIIDHPMSGHAAAKGLLLPLDEHLDAQVLERLAAQSAGPSHASYQHEGHQWAVAVDAACLVSASRPDLMRSAGLDVPVAWEEVLELARVPGRVLAPFWPLDTLAIFVSLCAAYGGTPFDATEGRFVERAVGDHALQQVARLFRLVPGRCIAMSPVNVLDELASGAEALYAPFTFGYSNYSRVGYRPILLEFHDLPASVDGRLCGSLLGGTGLAISAASRNPEVALDYLAWVAGDECQRTTYVLSGGQPGNRAAWDDDLANQITRDFFRNTRQSLDTALVRPVRDGTIPFQTAAGAILHEFLRDQRAAEDTLAALDSLTRTLLTPA